MKLRHIALIGSLFPFLLAIVLFFGVLISAEDDDGGGGSSSWVTGMNLSAEVLKHQPMVEKYAKVRVRPLSAGNHTGGKWRDSRGRYAEFREHGLTA